MGSNRIFKSPPSLDAAQARSPVQPPPQPHPQPPPHLPPLYPQHMYEDLPPVARVDAWDFNRRNKRLDESGNEWDPATRTARVRELRIRLRGALNTWEVEIDKRGVEINAQDDKKNIFFYKNEAQPNNADYANLLKQLRSRLASENDVQLENSGGEVITVIIDTENVYVVGYVETRSSSSLRPTLHYLRDNPSEALLLQAFHNPHYTHSRLGFAGNYDSLPSRETIPIGHGALNDAIRNLYYGGSQRSQEISVLVIIQMVAEAVRIKPVEVRSVSNQVVLITSVVSALQRAWLALMLYRCNPNTPKAALLRMPLGAADEQQCPYVEPTTNIIGRDGQCMNVRDNNYHNGNSIILWPCGSAQGNQLWTFKSDGTIRSNGKCLTTYGYAAGNYIMIYDCDTAVVEATKWFLYDIIGTITNPTSGLVIAAESAAQGTTLTVAEDNNSSRQAWTAGNYTEPTISYISGFREMCLQANGENVGVWLENCAIGTEPRQQWALYGDRTIRLYSDRTLCVTSYGHESSDIIILLKCQGWGNQRWAFMSDGTILNPNARLVMDVHQSDVSLKQLILYQPTGNPEQQWLAF
ncbi:hypothetical protein E3N88_15517 [Mikania micrantha]|uniref:Ribosome-inactivating protein n=1 Tax=Mikania micrantha TaxID=192012 RepID=A0A5N6NX02_9ASTR|nr:hypothetical protein E3N88_15517 [Mikania micrantha]